MSPANTLEARVIALEKELAEMKVGSKNEAFVFIKPHAVTDKVFELVKAKFDAEGIKIVKIGELSAETIDKNLLIDTHYGAIASKAVKLKPNELNLTEGALKDFEKMSGMSWDAALKKGVVYNAKDFCAKVNLTGEQLDELWSKLKRNVTLIKFGGGFYCAEIEFNGSKFYVINGFYMAMRGKFTAPGSKIKYMVVQFSPEKLSWSDFRNKVLGTTDPATADKGSLRREVFDDWKSLGLEFVPNTGDNSLHASASPFEAFCERCNWLSVPIEADSFGKALLANGVPKKTIEEFMQDPAVSFEGKIQSVFDMLEDMDGADCLAKCIEIAKANSN